MEIEKTRETSWKIQLKKNHENIELTSVEISGDVHTIRLALLKDDQSIIVEMSKEEFFNFLSLVSAFKDVVIGEDSFILEDSLLSEEEEERYHSVDIEEEEIYQSHPESTEDQLENREKEELNPEEWDPW